MGRSGRELGGKAAQPGTPGHRLGPKWHRGNKVKCAQKVLGPWAFGLIPHVRRACPVTLCAARPVIVVVATSTYLGMVLWAYCIHTDPMHDREWPEVLVAR
jgi:hypothetical protein